jgi:hypothetical protein
MRFFTLKINNPVVWFASILLILALYQASSSDRVESAIRSDGRGYYAYLPALLIYNDATYQSSMQAEKRNSPQISDQLYVYKDENGNFYNKYFPGLAVMQLPFFGMACFTSWISGSPVDGYSDIFYFFIFLGGLFYGIAGIFLYARTLKLLFPAHSRLIEWLVPIFYIASTLLFYSFDTPGFSHLYSFFLFGVFSLAVLQLRDKLTFKKLFFLGAIVGLIVLIRPTNGLIVLMIPFLLGDFQAFKKFFQGLFEKKGANFFAGLIGFGLLVFIQLACWKWQSGEWIKWSYNGEGFNFLRPQLIAGFFSFRIGLFLHVPIMLLAILGGIILFRKQPFQALIWVLYFVLNSWLIFSWWCWDYESSFGPRAFTEHLFFLLIPVVYFVVRYQKWLVVLCLGVVTINGGIRYFEIQTDFLKDQRFTRQNFLSSLQFWQDENKGRWNFTRSVLPHGKLVQSEVLLSDQRVCAIEPETVFSYTVEKVLQQPRTNERMYYQVKLDKKQNEAKFEGVLLVIDAYTKDQKKRYYRTVELLNDRFEGQKEWAHLVFEGQIYDNFQEYDFVKFYIWNQGKKSFEVKDIEIRFDTYKN